MKNLKILLTLILIKLCPRLHLHFLDHLRKLASLGFVFELNKSILPLKQLLYQQFYLTKYHVTFQSLDVLILPALLQLQFQPLFLSICFPRPSSCSVLFSCTNN